MPIEKFIDRKFSTTNMRLVEQANAIIDEYQAQGFTLTLRQLYYQFVARGLIPNKQDEYRKLGVAVNAGRMAGLIDWDAIEDRTRNLERQPSWSDPNQILRDVATQYRSNPWDSQPYQVEVWVEKEALAGVVEPACRRWRIAYFPCRGYTSQSEQWRAGKRLEQYCERGQNVLVLHLGDHDPSGIDMTRDNDARLRLFAGFSDNAWGRDEYGGLEFKRIALNMDQVRRYNPPPNPAKTTDARFRDYARKYGSQSWELDALSPTIIDELIDAEIEDIVDTVSWDRVLLRESIERESLSKLSRDWKIEDE
jgi:hypothetical protein